MSPLRQALCAIALTGLFGLLLWGFEGHIDAAEADTRLAKQDAKAARDDADRNLATVRTLEDAIKNERAAQVLLQTQRNQLRQGLAAREQQIEALKRENSELRIWADQPLPDAARRLRERPALTGADAYRQWLSGRGAVPPASDRTGQ